MTNALRTTADAKPAVLLTGGAGFVGSHVAGALAGRWTVRVFDNLSHGSLDNLPPHPDIAIEIGDIRSEAALRLAFAAGPFDAVVHCAAQTSVPRSMAEPEFDWAVTVQGTRLLARLAREQGVRRFVFVSSGGAIYGEAEAPASEATLPRPLSYYGLHKYVAEQIIRTEGLRHSILRPSNIYGPRQRPDCDGGVVAIFLERMLAGLPVDLFGDGQQKRDFVYVGDVVRAVEAALAADGDVLWNVSSGVAASLNDLIRLLGRLTGQPVRVRHLPVRRGDVRCSILSRSALARVLGSATPIERGLELTLVSLKATCTTGQMTALNLSEPAGR